MERRPRTQRLGASPSDNLGDFPGFNIRILTRQRKRKDEQDREKENRRASKMPKRKVPLLKPILSGREKLLQHRVNLFNGTEKGAGGASIKTDSDTAAKTKKARQSKRHRRNAVAKKRAQKEVSSD